MGLFIKKDVILHSGKESDFKIDCDALSDTDIRTLAYLISKEIKFCSVTGIPRGGIKLASALREFISTDTNTILIVDDVCTTGKSFEDELTKLNIDVQERRVKGVCIFSRGQTPDWVTPIFQMNNNFLNETL